MKYPTGQNHGAKSRQAGRVVEKNGGGEGRAVLLFFGACRSR
jgi:hypothetical protein